MVSGALLSVGGKRDQPQLMHGEEAWSQSGNRKIVKYRNCGHTKELPPTGMLLIGLWPFAQIQHKALSMVLNSVLPA